MPFIEGNKISEEIGKEFRMTTQERINWRGHSLKLKKIDFEIKT